MAQSSSLGHLKFMQRAKLRDEQKKAALATEEVANDTLKTPGTGDRKCVVIVEGDPLPGAGNGRMSFQPAPTSTEKNVISEKIVGDSAIGEKIT